MSGDADWGPWVDHDGRGCPCLGMAVEILRWGYDHTEYSPRVGRHNSPAFLNGSPFSAWVWTKPQIGKVSRYRVRRPKALRDLIALVENLPTPAPQPETVPA